MKVLDFQELEIYLTPFTPFPFVKGGNNKNLVVCQPENDGCRGGRGCRGVGEVRGVGDVGG
jgi:hypothetical protein